jgi:AmmeMemoRadiSam system protein A
MTVAERLSSEVRARLLTLARDAAGAAVRGQRLSAPRSAGADESLSGAAGAFVTLRRADGELRGCVGYVEAPGTLEETVALAAAAAATRDGRFVPVSPEEMADLVVEISVLRKPFAISAEAVVVGRHGLIAEKSGRRGLLLPQVPGEQGWDREEFLEGVCRKAGLNPGAWREKATRLYAFEADVFSEAQLTPHT